MKKILLAGVAIFAAVAMNSTADATVAYDTTLTAPPGLYFGSGNQNLHFTVDTEPGIEIGLSAINRYIGPITPVGNLYEVATDDTTVPGKTGSIWGVDFSIYNTDVGGTLNGFTATLTVTDQNNNVVNALLNPGPLAIPDNTCTDGVGKLPGSCDYTTAKGVQNSEAGSFLPGAGGFNVDDGFQDWTLNTYTYTLTVTNTNTGVTATDTIILNAVPEPGTIGVLGAGLAGLGLAWRRRRSTLAA